MLSIFRKVHDILTSTERRQLYLLLVAVVITALIEAAGIASILPFMAVLANPEVIFSNPYLSALYTRMGFEEQLHFLMFLGGAAFAFIVISNAVSAGTQWLLMRFTHVRGHSLSERLLTNYLSQPYAFFLKRNTAELGKNILAEVNRVLSGILVPGMQMLARSVAVLAILTLLFVIDPVLALVIGTVLGSAYALIFWLVRRKLTRIGRETVVNAGLRFKLAGEALGGIKEVRLLGREAEFIRRYAGPSLAFAHHQATSRLLGLLPKYALESVAFGGILLITLYLMATREDFSQVLPILALYAVGGYRLMPALQQVFSGVTSLRYHLPALEALHEDLTTRLPGPVSLDEDTAPLPLKETIALDSVFFAFEGEADPVLRGLSLEIPRGASVGLVGSTGAGKTTLVDVLLGLLEPQQGRIRIDGATLTEANVRGWQRNVGYVPQHIFLSDDTVAANIAFGIVPENIDHAAVERAARVAHLHEFIVDELPQGYETVVGERGVRLSGGQRQRIGIARALYHNPEVIVLDEATSALDGMTEQHIMEAVKDLAGEKTLIMIAHRLNTLQDCDIIYFLEKGRVAVSGTYTELMSTYPQFRAMAKVKPDAEAGGPD